LVLEKTGENIGVPAVAKELAFVLINPYTIAKSRTGGVIARCIARTDLDFVAARMFGPSRDLATSYADLVRSSRKDGDPEITDLVADYILRCYTPDPETGKPRRVMLLLFEGEDAIRKVWTVAGNATLRSDTGETIRDTYGDYILDAEGNVVHFEPAVLVAPTRQRAAATLKLWARHSANDGGMVETAADVPSGEDVEKTLVLIKPDNFRFPSARPGNIIDLLSSSGLRIVGVHKTCMTVGQAERFYAPVRESLRSRFGEIGAERVAAALTDEFRIDIPSGVIAAVSGQLAPLFAQAQFEEIIKFMTGYKPSECTAIEKRLLGSEECLAMVYEGINAVAKIRAIIGPTDPSKARPGSVRREFGSSIMTNAAHASDSVENAMREMDIIGVGKDSIRDIVARHYGNIVSRVEAMCASLPRVRCEFVRKMRTQIRPHGA